MKYIALLRGINVGGKNKVEMSCLASLFESLGYDDASTYINTGNILFESQENFKIILENIKTSFETVFGFNVPIIVIKQKDILRIAESVPKDWQNDKEQKSDVAYLFPEIDSENTIEQLPLNREYIDVRYEAGAIIWNVKRINQNQSQLNKLASHKLYKLMTVRNINTARYLVI